MLMSSFIPLVMETDGAAFSRMDPGLDCTERSWEMSLTLEQQTCLSFQTGAADNFVFQVSINEAHVFVSSREHLMFTVPHNFAQSCFMIKSPSELPKFLTIVKPFTETVWIGTALVVFA